MSGLTNEELRAMVALALQTEPEASLDRVQIRLRSREGRSLESDEVQRLAQIYNSDYAAAASAIVTDRAARVATMENLVHARPNAKELIGLFAAVAPLFIHFQTSTGSKAATTYFDLIALVGGIVAIIAGLNAVALLQRGAQRPFHLAVTALILLLGVYQLILGLGLFHRMGIYQI